VDELSKEFNLSQTPIREALYKLAGMNLITIKPRKGVYVASVAKQDILDILDIRKALENLAIEKISVISDDLTEKMSYNLRLFKKTIKTSDLAANNEMDRAFHLLIIEASGSKQLSRIYQNLHSHIYIERLLYKDERQALAELRVVEEEHRRIIQAFTKKDKKEIRKTVRSHLANVRQRIERKI